MSVETLSPSINVRLDLGNNYGSGGGSPFQPLGGGGGLGGASNGAINFGGPSSSSYASNNQQGYGQGSQEDTIADLVKQLLEQVGSQLMQFFQQLNQNGAGASGSDTGGGSGSGGATPAIGSGSGTSGGDSPISYGQSGIPQQKEALVTPSAAPVDPVTQTAAASKPTTDTGDSGKVDGTTSTPAATEGSQVVGSGPRTFNITNDQDHDITVGQFDQNENLVAKMTLKPGETGQMKYENDFTGLVKQADSEGNFKSDASRLEFYNGYVNTSDIDGRNASIYATDNNGFEIGDKQSIADGAPEGTVTTDKAGNKTIAGWYDGSTETMQKGGQYMVDKLGTGMTYMHPADDQLGEGNNPMRHTDAMTLDVTFGKA